MKTAPYLIPMSQFEFVVRNALTPAGSIGLLRGELAKKCSCDIKKIDNWFRLHGKKAGAVIKVGPGHYALKEAIEGAKEKEVPAVSSRLVKEARKPRSESNVRWTRARQIPSTPEQFELTGKRMTEVPGEAERLAELVADLWWEKPLEFTIIGAVQKVLENPELRGDIRYRRIATLSQIQQTRDGRSVYHLIHDKIKGIKELVENSGTTIEPTIVEIEKTFTPEQILSCLTWEAKVNLLVGLLADESTKIFGFMARLSEMAGKPVSFPNGNGNGYHAPPVKPAAPAPLAEKRKPVIGFLSSVATEQGNRLVQRVKDVVDLEIINVRDGGKITYPARWVGMFADTKHAALNYFANAGRAAMEKTGRFYYCCNGFHAAEEMILDYAQKLR